MKLSKNKDKQLISEEFKEQEDNESEEIIFDQPIKMKFRKKMINKSIKNKRNIYAPKIPENKIKPGKKQIRFKKPKYSKLLKDKCIKLMYLTPAWKKTFGQLSRYLVFNKNYACNEKLLIEILKDYDNKYENINNIHKIKELIINAYKTYYNKLKKYIYISWKNEDKTIFANELLSEKTSIEDIIHNNLYLITSIDIMMISLYLKIGIVLFYPSRENYNLKIGYYDENKSYYIKVTNNKYYLVVSEDKYYFNKNELNMLFVKSIENEYKKPIKYRFT